MRGEPGPPGNAVPPNGEAPYGNTTTVVGPKGDQGMKGSTVSQRLLIRDNQISFRLITRKLHIF